VGRYRRDLLRTTYLLLLSSHDLRPAILLIRLGGRIRGAVLLQTSFHAVDRAAADFQAAVDGCRVDAGFEELDDLLLHVGSLFAAAGHDGGVVSDFGREMGCFVPRLDGPTCFWCEELVMLAGESAGFWRVRVALVCFGWWPL
jgi:hypothetical protein